MTYEKKLEIIRDCIEDIIEFERNNDLVYNEKQHISRAIATYNNLYENAQKGKIDIDLLHENISSFLYMLQ